jgi:hypothetical protein
MTGDLFRLVGNPFRPSQEECTHACPHAAVSAGGVSIPQSAQP